jgi:arylsulfatase A-like enzyme
MRSGSPRSAAISGRDRPADWFIAWTSVLTGICLPLEFLWTLPGQRAYLTWSGIARSYLLGFIGCLFLAGAIVLITKTINWTLLLLRRPAPVCLWTQLHSAAAWSAASFVCAEAINRWASSFSEQFRMPANTSGTIIAIATAALVLWSERRGDVAGNSLRKEFTGYFAVGGSTVAGIALAVVLFAGKDHRNETLAADSLSESSRNPRPNIVLVTVDTLSALHSSLYGYSRDTTPGLETLAQKATVFHNFYANSNFTTTAVASIHTGMRPWRHQVYSLIGWIPQSLGKQTIAPRLQRYGYETVCFVSNPNADPRHWGGNFGFNMRTSLHGGTSLERSLSPMLAWKEANWYRSRLHFPFSLAESLDKRMGAENKTGLMWAFPSEQVYDRAAAYLQKRKPSSDSPPLFLWVHTFPPHDPYLPPAAFQRHYNAGNSFLSAAEQHRFLSGWYDSSRQNEVDILRDRYDEQVRYADNRLMQFLDKLDTLLPPQKTLLVVTSDHGESFEKGFIRHTGPLLHEALIKVPLLIRYPGQSKGSVVDSPAEQVDLLPTILAEAGLDIPAELEGRPLGPMHTPSDAASRNTVWSMSVDSNPSIDRLSRYTVAGIQGNLKYVAAMEQGWFAWERLFDLASDPNELNDLAASRLLEVADFRQAFLQQLAGAESFRMRTGFP